jgi:hypothetical protein
MILVSAIVSISFATISSLYAFILLYLTTERREKLKKLFESMKTSNLKQ